MTGTQNEQNPWIKIEPGCQLPEPDQWVLVFEDDRDSAQDFYIQKFLGNEPRKRVSPAKLLEIDREGWPCFYLCYIGGPVTSIYRNITHWRYLPECPKVHYDEIV